MPTVQDAIAHADAALHLLKKTVEQESWLSASIGANVQKKLASFKVGHCYSLLMSLCTVLLLRLGCIGSHFRC